MPICRKMPALGEEYSQRNRPGMKKIWKGYYVLILGFTIMGFVGAQPIRATFSSYHENTDTGKDTTMPGDTSFNNYFEQPTGTTYALQLWIQPSTEGPSVYFFTPKAPQTSRRMGLLVSYGQSFCRAAAMMGNKKFLSVSTGPPEMQVHNLNFDTLTNFYAQTSWAFDSSITGTWSIKTEPMFNNYVYYIDGSALPINYLYKWDSTKTARDPGPGIVLGSEVCRSGQFLGVLG